MIELKLKNNTPPIGQTPANINTSLFDKVDYDRLNKYAHRHAACKHLLIIGNGGSVNTFRGVYGALKNYATPKVTILDTNEPAVLEKINNEINPKETLLLSISKSGQNLSQLQATLFFSHLPHQIFITQNNSQLGMLAKSLNSEILPHPDLQGRFSGFSLVNLLPMALCGFDVHGFMDKAQKEQEALNSLTWNIAETLFELEKQNTTELYVFSYLDGLKEFGLFAQQLMHETAAKNEQGLSLQYFSAPEAQHHTLQRILAGRRNTAVLLISGNQPTIKISSSNAHTFDKNTITAKLNKKDLRQIYSLEVEAILQVLQKHKIPIFGLQTGAISSSLLGEYVYFWQMLAITSAYLRKLNPCDQPQVEEVKQTIWKKIING